jgi:hypothetical protein
MCLCMEEQRMLWNEGGEFHAGGDKAKRRNSAVPYSEIVED